MADEVMAALDPHQDCVAFSIEENRCTCDALLVIDNDCAEALSAVGFSFRSCERGEVGCQDQGASSGETAVIAPGARATLDLPRPGADGLGEQSAELAVELGASEAVLTVRYEMVHLARDGAGCAAARSDHGASLALVLAAVILGLARACSPSMRWPRVFHDRTPEPPGQPVRAATYDTPYLEEESVRLAEPAEVDADAPGVDAPPEIPELPEP